MHSWLENEILCTQPLNIVNRRADGSWKSDNKIFTHLKNIESVRKLVDDMIQGFSPVQLVDQLGPLQKCSPETRLRIKEIVHNAYLEDSGIKGLAKSLEQVVNVFSEEFNTFIKAWNEGNDNELKKAWQGVLNKAANMLKVFEKLPKGVVVP